jgi:Fe-S-cluster containining protein
MKRPILLAPEAGRTPPPGYELVSFTRPLRSGLDALTPALQVKALALFEQWLESCLSLLGRPPMDVAFSLHLELDKSAERQAMHSPEFAAQVQCRKGCAHCCYLPVDIYPQEAVLLRELARAVGIEIDEARLERQATKNIDTWDELSPEDRRCVFLADDRSCSVYEHRPGPCRNYKVVSPPDQCDSIKHPGGDVKIVFNCDAELIQSAAMTVFKADSMSKQLIAARTKEPA